MQSSAWQHSIVIGQNFETPIALQCSQKTYSWADLGLGLRKISFNNHTKSLVNSIFGSWKNPAKSALVEEFLFHSTC